MKKKIEHNYARDYFRAVALLREIHDNLMTQDGVVVVAVEPEDGEYTYTMPSGHEFSLAPALPDTVMYRIEKEIGV